jgi:hypothetical protein
MISTLVLAVGLAFAIGYIPGFMHAAITDTLFWVGLGIILPAGYAVAYPAMYWAMKREQKKGIEAHHP